MTTEERQRIHNEHELAAIVMAADDPEEARRALSRLSAAAHLGFITKSPQQAAMYALKNRPYACRMYAAILLRDAPCSYAIHTLKSALAANGGMYLLPEIIEAAIYNTEALPRFVDPNPTS